ncbi:unnamed protein product [Protopolystoma xenopodis]|uniref:Uncharacterized protein n=1 Tax=Protopolystoma xenopodis TaxID=117903 RepID=A0A448XAX4_9PLAT|nr:unnamed protein product [Protopolystoma xenopodis]
MASSAVHKCALRNQSLTCPIPLIEAVGLKDCFECTVRASRLLPKEAVIDGYVDNDLDHNQSDISESQ